MLGQWIGAFTGTNSGELIIDIDRVNEEFIGSASVFDQDRNLPNFHSDFSFPTKLAESGSFSVRIFSPIIYESTGQMRSDTNAYVDTDWDIDNEKVNITWKSSEGTTGTAICVRSNASEPSELEQEVLTWEEVKSKFFGLQRDTFVFRGQRNSRWRLQTGFHRRGRYNLSRFESYDIPLLHAETSSKTRYVFDLSKPLENAAFYALIQHHGYPTPLLDWTYSPFVAAYFAFRDLVMSDEAAKVRIFVFDAKNWRADFNQLPFVKTIRPHFSLLKPLALENPRMAPQHSVFSVTNIADIESYLLKRSSENSKKYIGAIDIPVAHRTEALNDLSLMGISSASLFPGIDGICEYQANRNFS